MAKPKHIAVDAHNPVIEVKWKTIQTTRGPKTNIVKVTPGKNRPRKRSLRKSPHTGLDFQTYDQGDFHDMPDPLKFPSKVRLSCILEICPLETPLFQTQNEFLREWQNHKELYLDILLQLEGPPEPQECSHCVRDGTYRCLDCFRRPLFCTSWFRENHRSHPFHWVEQWTGNHFQESSLRLARLTLHLGHDGGVCPSGVREGPQEVPDEEWEPSKPGARPPHLWVTDTPGYLVVVDASGIHYYNLAYCNCSDIDWCDTGHDNIQLLGAGLFPASTAFPSIVFTFKVLEHFLRDNVECGIAAMNYFSKLKTITSNVFPHLVPDEYRELLWVARICRVLKLFKWNGFGHDLSVIYRILTSQLHSSGAYFGLTPPLSPY
ncbi:hypothetical protein PAXRUDRAFT_144047 [Paxillus rubicundulus Ve08.2h10]|uniref:Unplaced genomic scaffold scaffold_325, whole genome shotgun sequence n=1 Tax=Paxillus rubicundulus Ve08.2h10 TaxID=930991 RepID=A0A0D0E156_9AGAM|nr:hypothetical protein PAXRUDRAFT_144047 [Paxillus rubicundulus Ve08.2h10]